MAVTSKAHDDCCASLNVEPFRVQMIRETACVSLVRFDHPPDIKLPTTYSSHDAAEHFRVNIVEHGWFRLKYGRREWTLGAGSMFLSRPTEVYGYSHVKYAEPDTCLRVEFSGPIADELRRSVFRLPLVLPTTNRLSFLRLRLSSLLSNAAEMSLDALACELVDAANRAGGTDNVTALFVAGPEFSGCPGVTRARFTATRIRVTARLLTGRMAFLIYGLLLGMLLWAVLPARG